ncbi:hypothetical protein BKA65DRAFT_544835 [Rhexocercosporidium sp. MPI-PUGE-AT-0058]|nr:hypothetical protein BKA65DRAFT_544835 [Rhexocercosporidium sp. MPI-PUGE-AT-0058]
MNNTNNQVSANMAPAGPATAPATLPTLPTCPEPGCGKSYVHKIDLDDHEFTKHRGGKKWR